MKRQRLTLFFHSYFTLVTGLVKEGFAIAPEALIVTRGAGGSHLRKLIGSSIPLHVMHDVNNKIPDLGQCKYIILMGLKRIQESKKRKKIN